MTTPAEPAAPPDRSRVDAPYAPGIAFAAAGAGLLAALPPGPWDADSGAEAASGVLVEILMGFVAGG
ncbi:MAG: hypothetical protein AB7V62_10540 [Thermoleophilia bacterium]